MRGDSSRVRLEVAFLDADDGVSAPLTPAAPDERAWRTVLVVAAEPDVRRYVGECLRERTDLRLVEAATVSAAVALAASYSPALLVVDEPERDVVAALAQLRAIVIVDDVPRGAGAMAERVRLLARPFTAEGLLAEVVDLLG
jgi:CheY-like chemotaxis protein